MSKAVYAGQLGELLCCKHRRPPSCLLYSLSQSAVDGYCIFTYMRRLREVCCCGTLPMVVYSASGDFEHMERAFLDMNCPVQ